jgi:nitrate reductase NapD
LLSVSSHFPRYERTTIESSVLNISSAIVYAKPGEDLALRSYLSQIPGVEIHATTDDGKMIVTIETENDRSAVDTYEAIERMDGVLSVAMIFQQTESHPDQELLKCK